MKPQIKKYLAGESSSAEQKELLEWLQKEGHLSDFESVKEEWKDEIIKKEHAPEYQQNWIDFQNSIHEKLQVQLFQANRFLKFFQYAAIFTLLILVPAIIYMTQFKSPDKNLVYTTVAADLGQISKVVLPDSTTIWINSGSTIKYNNQFSASNRDIKLTGEAYFKVSRNEKLPLVVSSGDLRVKVLGTEFSVIAYPDEKNIQVVLEKGKVELTSASQSNWLQKMNPGQMASFSKEKKETTLSSVNTELFTSWKDGLINIYNLPLSELARRLEKRYNQKFVVDEEIKNLPYTFTIKNENLSSVLSLMEKITPVDVFQNGNVIELKYRGKTNKKN